MKIIFGLTVLLLVAINYALFRAEGLEDEREDDEPPIGI